MTTTPMTDEQCQQVWAAIPKFYKWTWQAQGASSREDGLYFQVLIEGAEKPGHIHKFKITRMGIGEDDQVLYNVELMAIDLLNPTEPRHLDFALPVPESDLGRAIHMLCLRVDVREIPLTVEEG